jgi:hypothetical protein
LPEIAFIICSKRHHTRFFPRDHPSTDFGGKGNCWPGLVVDSGSRMFTPFPVQLVCNRTWWTRPRLLSSSLCGFLSSVSKGTPRKWDILHVNLYQLKKLSASRPTHFTILSDPRPPMDLYVDCIF